MQDQSQSKQVHPTFWLKLDLVVRYQERLLALDGHIISPPPVNGWGRKEEFSDL